MKSNDLFIYATKWRLLFAVVVPAGVLWLLVFSGLLDDLPKKGWLVGLWKTVHFLALAYVVFGGRSYN